MPVHRDAKVGQPHPMKEPTRVKGDTVSRMGRQIPTKPIAPHCTTA